MKGAAAVAEILKREGVQFLIGYPVNPIIEAAAVADIRTIIVRQERVGLPMADAGSRLSAGRPGGGLGPPPGPPPAAPRPPSPRAKTGRPGPVLVELPADVLAEEVPEPLAYRPPMRTRTAPDPHAVAGAAAGPGGAGRPGGPPG